MHTRKLSLIAFILALLPAAVMSGNAQQTEESSAANTLEVGEFTFRYGDDWKAKDRARPMSQGSLTIKPTLDADVELEAVDADFYHFGKGQGGSIEANIERWKGQFSGTPEMSEEDLADGKIKLIHLKGTFLSGPPFGEKTPMENYAVLGAILPSEEGAVFV